MFSEFVLIVTKQSILCYFFCCCNNSVYLLNPLVLLLAKVTAFKVWKSLFLEVFHSLKTQKFSGGFAPEPPPGLCPGPVGGLTAPPKPPAAFDTPKACSKGLPAFHLSLIFIPLT